MLAAMGICFSLFEIMVDLRDNACQRGLSVYFSCFKLGTSTHVPSTLDNFSHCYWIILNALEAESL